MASISFHGSPVTTIGELPVVGSPAPAFELVGADLGEVTSASLAGRRVVVSIFPSVDTGVCAKTEVYAWMPMLAVNAGKGYEYVTDHRTQMPNAAHYLRLSPYNEKNRKLLEDLYEDLAFHARFNGIIFHDDGLLAVDRKSVV